MLGRLCDKSFLESATRVMTYIRERDVDRLSSSTFKNMADYESMVSFYESLIKSTTDKLPQEAGICAVHVLRELSLAFAFLPIDQAVLVRVILGEKVQEIRVLNEAFVLHLCHYRILGIDTTNVFKAYENIIRQIEETPISKRRKGTYIARDAATAVGDDGKTASPEHIVFYFVPEALDRLRVAVAL